MDVLVSQIQSQHGECAADVWSPDAVDLGSGGTPVVTVGNCYGTAGVGVARSTNPLVGTQVVPDGLFAGPAATALTRVTSGRDSENNIIVYFADDLPQRPSDGASCWLYFARLKQWHANFY